MGTSEIEQAIICPGCNREAMGDELITPTESACLVKLYYCPACRRTLHNKCVKRGFMGFTEKCPACRNNIKSVERVWCIPKYESANIQKKVIAYWFCGNTVLTEFGFDKIETHILACFFISRNVSILFPESIVRITPHLFHTDKWYYPTTPFITTPTITTKPCPYCGGSGRKLMGGLLQGVPAGGYVACGYCKGTGKVTA